MVWIIFPGAITTLGRGGSDLTATVLGAALELPEVQVWKDVDGEELWWSACGTVDEEAQACRWRAAAFCCI